MPINKRNLKQAYRMVGSRHGHCIARLAESQDKLENKWAAETGRLHGEITTEILRQLTADGKVKLDDKPFEIFLLSHYFHVLHEAIVSTEEEFDAFLPEKVKLAKKPSKPHIPASLKNLRIIYDRYRKTGRLPRGFKEKAVGIKKQYLNKTQSVWKKYAEDFREGKTFTQEDVLRKVKKAAGAAESRARTVVRTETTNYYNKARREIYDQSDVVWGYLFLAIRDQGTTKWCSDKVQGGKRGRHGLVFKKGDPLTDKETPSCHWNCRSEFTPLSIFNPRHRKLIEDLSLRRRNNTCHPLPKGWAA